MAKLPAQQLRIGEAVPGPLRLALGDVLPDQARHAQALLSAFAEIKAFTKPRLFDDELRRSIARLNQPTVLQLDGFRAAPGRLVAQHQSVRDLMAAVAQQQATTFNLLGKATKPWALRDFSVVPPPKAARLGPLGDIIAKAGPYKPRASGHEERERVPFELETGPVEHDVAGVETTTPQVVTFPPPARVPPPLVFVSPGFEVKLPFLHAPTSDNGDRTGNFDSRDHALLLQMEHRLRDLIAAELSQAEGSAWIRRRVPSEIKKKWDQRRQQDRDHRGDSYAPVYYADLMDLADIICRNDNWKAVFSPIFKDREDFRVSMQRISPIRNAIAHGRPLVPTDRLCLSVEV